MTAPATAGRPALEIRSFRLVFALERRIHRVDRWRIPLPYGLPVRAALYAAAALALLVLAGRLPGVGGLIGLVPAPVRFVIAPAAAGFLLSRVRVDGRPAHRYLFARARHASAPRHLSAFRPTTPPGREQRVAEPIAFVPDWRCVTGPARVAVVRGAELEPTRRGRRLVVRPTGAALARPRVVQVERGAEVVFR